MRTGVRTYLQDVFDRPLSPSAPELLVLAKQENVEEGNDFAAPDGDRDSWYHVGESQAFTVTLPLLGLQF